MNSANADLYRGLGREGDRWRFEHAGTLAPQNIEGHDVSPTVMAAYAPADLASVER